MRGLKTMLVATRSMVAAVILVLGLSFTTAAQDPDRTELEAAPIDEQSAWSLGKFPEPGRGPATVRAVTAGPKGFVAVGESCPKRFSCIAAAWTSRDGRKWQVVDVDRAERAAGRSIGSSLLDVAWGPRGFIAVGETRPPWVDVSPGTEGPEPVAAVWRSKDGKRWRRTVTGAPLSSNPLPSQVVATDAGYVALSPGRSKVMASPDGVKWAKRPPGRPGLTGTFAALTPLPKGVAVLGPARVQSAEGERSHSSAIWRSRGPDAWTPQVVAGEDSYLARLAAIGDRVVVVQGPWMFDEYVVPHGGLTRAIDRDGRVVMGSVPGADGLYAVGAAGDRFLVAGQACGPALWASDDGIAWKRVAGPGKLPKGAPRWYDVDIAANGDRVVLVGTAERPGPDRRSQRPKLVNFALSAPLSALDPAEFETDATCVMEAEMPIAQLTTPDGTTVAGLPTTGCWLGEDPAGAPLAQCQDIAAPPPTELPLVRGAGKRVPLKLTLSDGSAFSAASVVGYHVSGDITSAGALVSTDPCEPQREVDFDVWDRNSVLIAEITFECGQGSSQYLFHFQSSGS
jgi:hypothetical protein